LTQKVPMLFGYARVLTDDQNLDLQHAVLIAPPCTGISQSWRAALFSNAPIM
jgi:hypothetical protein